jgi:hypothetical protein
MLLGELRPYLKHLAKLERLAGDKRSCLLLKFVNYGRNKLNRIGFIGESIMA